MKAKDDTTQKTKETVESPGETASLIERHNSDRISRSAQSLPILPTAPQFSRSTSMHASASDLLPTRSQRAPSNSHSQTTTAYRTYVTSIKDTSKPSSTREQIPQFLRETKYRSVLNRKPLTSQRGLHRQGSFFRLPLRSTSRDLRVDSGEASFRPRLEHNCSNNSNVSGVSAVSGLSVGTATVNGLDGDRFNNNGGGGNNNNRSNNIGDDFCANEGTSPLTMDEQVYNQELIVLNGNPHNGSTFCVVPIFHPFGKFRLSWDCWVCQFCLLSFYFVFCLLYYICRLLLFGVEWMVFCLV